MALFHGKVFTDNSTYTEMITSRGNQNIGLGPFTGKFESDEKYFYHPGHWGVMLFVLPERNLSITFTINQTNVDYTPFLDKIIELLNQLNVTSIRM